MIELASFGQVVSSEHKWAIVSYCVLCSLSLETWLGTVKEWRKDSDTEETTEDTRKSLGQVGGVHSDGVTPTIEETMRNLSIFIMCSTGGGVSLCQRAWTGSLAVIIVEEKAAVSTFCTCYSIIHKHWYLDQKKILTFWTWPIQGKFCYFPMAWRHFGLWPDCVHIDNNILSLFHPLCTFIQGFPGSPQSL